MSSRMRPFVVIQATNTPAPLDHSAAIELADTDKGFLPNRLTTARRNAIVNPATGLTIYNTDSNRLETWTGSSWTQDATTGALLAANNLSDLGSAATARTNLGLGSAATHAATDFDAAGAAAAAQTAAEAASDPVGSAATVQAASLQKSANLSDLGSAATARTNLGLGSAATHAATDFDAAGAAAAAQTASLQKSANLSDLGSAATARTNLGLSPIAASGSASDLTNGVTGSGAVVLAISPTLTTATFSTMTSGSLLFVSTGGLLSQDNSNLFWDGTNHRLGLGNASPQYQLDVKSKFTAASETKFINIADSGGQTRVEMWSNGEQDWYLNNGTTDVGSISLTTPNSNPGFVFWTDIAQSRDRFNMKLSHNAPNGGYGRFELQFNDGNSEFSLFSANANTRCAVDFWGKTSIGYFSIGTGDSERNLFFVDANGNIGIGVATGAAVQAKLDVKGAILTEGTTFSNLPGSPVAGMVAYVTDSTVSTGTVTAGGSTNKVLVWYNGTNWRVVAN